MSAGPRCQQPEALGAVVLFEGRTYMLALVRTFWLTVGSLVFEALQVNGEDSVAVEPGTWEIRRTDEGPSVLSIDVSLPDDLTSYPDELLGKLLDELVRKGAHWGIETRERLETEQAS